jgi:hypothetical protein
MTRTRVDLTHLGQVVQWKPARDSDKSRPDAPMDKGDLAIDQTTNKDLVAVADCTRHREDLVTFRMRPPVATNWLSGDGLDKRWDWPMRGFEHDTVLTNESKRLA